MSMPAWTSATFSWSWAWPRSAANAKAAPAKWWLSAALPRRWLPSSSPPPSRKAGHGLLSRFLRKPDPRCGYCARPTLMGLSASPPSPVRQLNRNLVIAGSVVLFHIAALWALQRGLLRRAVEIVVPVSILSEVVTPPLPKAEQPPQVVQPKPLPPPKQPVPRKVETARPPPPQ